MAASTDFDYDIILSLDKAKLVKRKRLNFLGSKELILDYHLTGGGTKEEATEYLEANRLTLTDPKFGFKTYDGTWKCVDIEFNEDAKIIRQRFKDDSSLEEDVAERSASGTVLKSYYWRVVDPDAYNVDDTVSDGEVYTKSATDNGDGTYDVVITKKTVPTVISGPSYRETALYTEAVTVSINNTEEAEPSWSVGTIVETQNTPQADGLFRTVVTVRTAKQFVPDSNWTYRWSNFDSSRLADPIDGNDAQNTHLYIDQGYSNDFLVQINSPHLISAHNVLKDNVDKVVAVLSDAGATWSGSSESINYASVNVNEFGLYDINMTRRFL